MLMERHQCTYLRSPVNDLVRLRAVNPYQRLVGLVAGKVRGEQFIRHSAGEFLHESTAQIIQIVFTNLTNQESPQTSTNCQ